MNRMVSGSTKPTQKRSRKYPSHRVTKSVRRSLIPGVHAFSLRDNMVEIRQTGYRSRGKSLNAVPGPDLPLKDELSRDQETSSGSGVFQDDQQPVEDEISADSRRPPSTETSVDPERLLEIGDFIDIEVSSDAEIRLRTGLASDIDFDESECGWPTVGVNEHNDYFRDLVGRVLQLTAHFCGSNREDEDESNTTTEDRLDLGRGSTNMESLGDLLYRSIRGSIPSQTMRLIGNLWSYLDLLYERHGEAVPGELIVLAGCLRSLYRYCTVVHENDLRDRELWANAARTWYDQAADLSRSTGRIQHRLAVLAHRNSSWAIESPLHEADMSEEKDHRPPSPDRLVNPKSARAHWLTRSDDGNTGSRLWSEVVDQENALTAAYQSPEQGQVRERHNDFVRLCGDLLREAQHQHDCGESRLLNLLLEHRVPEIWWETGWQQFLEHVESEGQVGEVDEYIQQARSEVLRLWNEVPVLRGHWEECLEELDRYSRRIYQVTESHDQDVVFSGSEVEDGSHGLVDFSKHWTQPLSAIGQTVLRGWDLVGARASAAVYRRIGYIFCTIDLAWVWGGG